VKKTRTSNVLPFPQATRSAEEKDFPPSTVIFQVGSDRVAIHMQYESLPPLPMWLVSPVTGETDDPIPPLLPRGPAVQPKTASKFMANRHRKSRPRSVPPLIQPTD
jgi:hypothetical protein